MKRKYECEDFSGTVQLEQSNSTLRVTDEDGSTIEVEVIPTPYGQMFLHENKVFDSFVGYEKPGEPAQVFLGGQMNLAQCFDPRKHSSSKASQNGAGSLTLKSTMPGRVVKLHVKIGDAVEPGTPLLVLEAMKMENEIAASLSARVKSVHVSEGDAVEGGSLMIEFENENS